MNNAVSSYNSLSLYSTWTFKWYQTTSAREHLTQLPSPQALMVTVCLLPFLQHSWGPLMLSSLMHFSSFIIPEIVQLYTREVRRNVVVYYTPLTVIHKNVYVFFFSSREHHFSKITHAKRTRGLFSPKCNLVLFHPKVEIVK